MTNNNNSFSQIKIAEKSKLVYEPKANTWYNGEITNVSEADTQLDLRVALTDLKNPEVHYKARRMWLQDEFTEGDLTFKFWEMFPDVDTVSKLFGLKFKVFLEKVSRDDGSFYLRIADIDKM